MLLSMRVLAGCLLLFSAGCAKQAAAPQSEKDAAHESPMSKGPASPFSKHCQYKLTPDRKATLLACDSEEVLAILPGDQWSAIEEGNPPTSLLFAASGALRISVLSADDEESKYPVGEHLTAIYTGISQELPGRGFKVQPPHVEEMENGHMVLTYEMSGTIEGTELRMVNSWTCMRRMNGQYYDYHVSFTQPSVHEAWQDPASVQRLTKLIADSFFVTDGKGNAPPQ
jgi:hypothetical protein